MIPVDTSSRIAFLSGEAGGDVEAVDLAFDQNLVVIPPAVLAKRLRARLADTLIAQACVDHRVPLITRDVDFRHFAKHAALKVLEF